MRSSQAIRSLLPARLRALLRHLREGALASPNARVSFSQEGEDLLLARLFESQSEGFFVDVGAHHPERFSNTRLLYARGWRGINIDATPGSMKAFDRARRRDINLEIAVASDEQMRHLYIFDEPALNSLSEDLSSRRHQTTDYAIDRRIQLATRPLKKILDEYLPEDVTSIDLMTIDVEGQDLDVLRSNDWSRYRPRVLVIEVLVSSLEELMDREEIRFMRGHGFSLYAKLVNSIILVNTGSPPS